jgi:DNA polymerase I-like protein with 3'-5' exonuclease and polymerase domains
MTGILWRVLKQYTTRMSEGCLMVNLVHDELVFDCRKEIVAEAMLLIKTTLEETPKYMKSIYGIDLGLPTKVEVTCGDNWKEQKVVAI